MIYSVKIGAIAISKMKIMKLLKYTYFLITSKHYFPHFVKRLMISTTVKSIFLRNQLPSNLVRV